MGLWLSRPRLSDSGYGACPDDNQSDRQSWTESEHGSYLKISICHRTPLNGSCSSSLVSSRHNSDASSDGNRDVSVQETARLFSQSEYMQRDAQIRNTANKLLNTTPGIMPSQRRGHAAALPLSPVRSIATEPITPLSVATALYNSLTPELTPTESQKRRKIIARSFLEHVHNLVEQVNPEEVAGKLYGIGILDQDEQQRAFNKNHSERARAEELVQLVKWKLWQSPEWFVDVCKIFRNCGVKVISQVIEQVCTECPAEEMSMLSTGSGSTTSAVTPIKQTSQVSYYDMIKKIEASFEMGGREAACQRVLEYAAEQGVAKELVNQACVRGVAVSTLELLLSVLNERGANSITNSKAECGRTPLHETCAALIADPSDDQDRVLEDNDRQRKKIDVLLSHGANHCAKDKDGNTPLHLAALRCDCDTVSMLLRSGRRCINIANKCGNTALHIACRRGRLDIVKVICGHRPNTSAQNNKCRTALHLACLHNHIDTALYLAEHDQSTLDAYDKHHRTPLHICCKKGNSLLALSLLRLKNCSPFKVDKDNKTPLHYAVDIENIGLVTSLLQKDAEMPKDPTRGLMMVNVQDKFGDTALHIAGRHGNKPIAKQLLNFKADDNILNEEGRNALEVAIESENCQFPKKMLRKRGWTQRRKLKRRIKMRRTLTQSTLSSSYQQSDVSETNDASSSESDDDENYSIGRRGTV